MGIIINGIFMSLCVIQALRTVPSMWGALLGLPWSATGTEKEARELRVGGKESPVPFPALSLRPL